MSEYYYNYLAYNLKETRFLIDLEFLGQIKYSCLHKTIKEHFNSKLKKLKLTDEGFKFNNTKKTSLLLNDYTNNEVELKIDYNESNISLPSEYEEIESLLEKNKK